MLAEKEEQVNELLRFAASNHNANLDFDQIENLNERARDIFELDDDLAD